MERPAPLNSAARRLVEPEPLAAEAAAALLKRFEPVVRSTRGDRFFPMDMEPYVRECGLWVQEPESEAVCEIPCGKLTLDRLAQQPRDRFGAVHFLKFAEPREVEASEDASHKPGRRLAALKKIAGPRDVFRVGRGRLARVGYTSRFADALYSIALLARGRVPGEAAAAAAVSYKRILAQREHYRYHGRALRQDGWLVLQYWLFYPFNDWRSGFFGANDHEADWEKVFVFLSESGDSEVHPEWVAYASHNYTGDNLRRRWDDPELEKVGEHPVLFVAAGSHASYFAPGEYLTELKLPLPRRLARMTDSIRSFWRKTLRQYSGGVNGPQPEDETSYFNIPFVDYARGDGLSIGPGGEKQWDPPRLMQDPAPAWVSGYRGLWGLYARDPFEGEDAPAGPMYNRDKSVSRTWYDPVGWAGLDKVPPPTEELDTIFEHRTAVEARCVALREDIEAKSHRLRGLGVEVAAMRGKSHLSEPYTARRAELEKLSEEVARLRASSASDEAVSRSLESYASRLRAGERDPARAHISRPHRPASDAELRTSRVAELWAAVSVSLMMIALVAIAAFRVEHLTSALVASIALFAFVEASFRGRLVNLVSSVNIGLGVVAALVILYEFFWEIVIAAVVVVGLYVLWDNLREFRR